MRPYDRQVRILTAIGLALIAVVFFVVVFTPLGGQRVFPNKSENREAIITTTAATTKAQGLVNINTASLEELETLPDIGETRAKNIIAYREANGGFDTVEDIQNVDGIGEKTFEKIKELIATDDN